MRNRLADHPPGAGDPELEREVHPVKPRARTVRLPAGSRHGFRNDMDTPARFLLAVSPGIQAVEMFRHFDRAGSAAPGGLAPPQIVAICKQYGVVME